MTLEDLGRTRRRAFFRLLRLGKAEEGAVMTEFVIIAPLYLFLILGMFQLMGVVHASSLLQYANFRALRTGIVHYEPIMNGWGPYASLSENQRQELLLDRMRTSAERSLGPIYRPIAEYEDLAGHQERPIGHSPVSVLDVRMQVTLLDVGNSSPKLPFWLTSQTEIDVGMPYPLAGRALETIHLGLHPQRGMQTGYSADPVPRMGATPDRGRAYGMPWLTLWSDSRLDTRRTMADEYWLPWPYSEASGQPIGGDSTGSINFTASRPLPATLPVQGRTRYRAGN